MHNITKRGQLKKLALALGLSGTFFLNACTSNAPSNQTIVTSTDDYEANLAANESESFYETESETFDREALYRTDDDNKPAEGWITNADGTMGYCQNGYLLTGYQMIDDSRYLFSDDGIMQTGRYIDENGDTYCFTDDGRQYFCSTVKCDDGYYYYFGEDGKAVTGNFTFPDGATGMTDENGHVYVGCHRIGDLVYDFTSQGKLRHTVDATKPMVALTYDDGPSTQNTQIILDTLTANGAYATFFVLGRNVERCADIIQNIENSGSEIGNHTYNHYKITNMDAQVTDQEISSTSSYVQMITGNRPCIMRPPTGATDDVSCANVAAVDDGYPLIMWCVDTIDWQHHDVATTCDTIRSKVKDGAIVLMHDMEASKRLLRFSQRQIRQLKHKCSRMRLKLWLRHSHRTLKALSLLNPYQILHQNLLLWKTQTLLPLQAVPLMTASRLFFRGRSKIGGQWPPYFYQFSGVLRRNSLLCLQ